MESNENSNKRSIVIELLLISFLSLFVELLVIRWLCCDFRLFTVFRTVPLVTCFVGLGVGLASGRSDLFKLTPLALLQMAITVKLGEFLSVTAFRFPAKATYFFQNIDMNDIWYLALCLMVILLLLAAPFALSVCIGARLGVLFNKLKPLVAYGIDISGAILGSVAFGALCFFGMGPEQLLIAAGLLVLVALVLQKELNWKHGAVVAAVAAIVLYPGYEVLGKHSSEYKTDSKTYWSPYQRLDLSVFHTLQDEFLGLELGTNRNFYQFYFNDKIAPEKGGTDFGQIIVNRRKQYELPYQMAAGNVKDVLILGAGTGQNIASALAHGATNVDAVDIDPVILQVGKEYNPSMNSPAVHPICDDARHFFKRNPDKKYDLIIFTLLDSQAVVGQGSSVRLDTYVYTKESIKQAISKLKPGGIIVMSFACLPWIAERLEKTIETAVGYPPIVAQIAGNNAFGGAYNAFFIIGDGVRDKTLKLPEGWAPIGITPMNETPILTDDWPYLYVRPEIIDFPYLALILGTVALSMWSGRKLLFGPSDRNCWRLFLLGAAFMLLELHAISLLSLVYGSTWITSAIVINGILMMILAANVLVLKFRPKLAAGETFVYLGLFASIIVSFFTSPQAVLTAMPGLSGELALTLITLLPIGFAGIIFPMAFSQSKDAARSLAFNLFGAVIGGLLEYLSNFIGIRNLELIALALYICSFLIMQPWQRTASASQGAEAAGAAEIG